MKKSLFILVLFFVVFLSTCQQGVQPKDSQIVSTISGSEGLRVNFLENLPPSRLFDNEQFNAVVQVENRGASPVGGPGDKVYISGFDPSKISGVSTFGAQIPPLRGRDPHVPEQIDLNTVSFKGIVGLLKNTGIVQLPVRILLTACYSYESLASPQVCIDPNPFSPNLKQKVCTAQPVSGGTQGAPVAISSVDVLPSPGNTKFKIYVNNVGGGRVFKSGLGALAKCSPFSGDWLTFNELDYVEVEDVIVSDVSIKNSCKPLDNNNLRLTNGQGVFWCEFNRIRGTSAYQTPIIIKLRYGYETTLIKNLDIYSSS